MARLATVVFVGPTLPAAEVAAALPDARVLPPAAVGDVLRASRRARRIALVDGYFEHTAAVWHKEILVALERGVEVWGAASMGALRAAELAGFGMRGVGRIYAAFAAGRLDADDEVAVAHLPAEHGFRPVSDALVNIRFGLAAATWLAPETRDALVELARARFYRERSWAQLDADARRARLPRAELDRLAAWRKPDQKARDARALLREVAAAPAVRGRGERVRVPRTWALRQLLRGAW